MSNKHFDFPIRSILCPFKDTKWRSRTFLFLLLFCIYTVHVLCAGESNEGVVQLLDPDLQLPPLNHKYWSLSYSYPPPYHKYWSLSNGYLHYITKTGPCHKITSPISEVMVPVQQLPPLYHVLKLPPLYHKYWSLSNSYLHHITSTGPCPKITSPLSQVLVPVQQLPPLYIYHKYWNLSYSYLPYITSNGPLPKVS